jgi:hypothetical protein
VARSDPPASCPFCGNILRRIGIPDLSTVALYVGVDLVFWLSVALILAYLAAPRGEGEAYAGLAALAIVAWLLLRPRQLAARRAFLERARYYCEHCDRHFEGEGPWQSGS